MSQVGKEPIAIDYMPWANFDEAFEVGPVSFWPFYKEAERRIPDPQVRTDLTNFFQTFVDNVGRPVDSVVVCSMGEVSFRPFTSDEVKTIRSAVDCLIFANVATGSKAGIHARNHSMAPPSADRFELAARWVWPCHSGLGVATENSLSYWSQGKYHIPHPLSVGGSFSGNYKPLLKSLGQVFGTYFPADLQQRLFRALEWFRFAHTESTAVSWVHKVVMMATAFEILLQFPKRGQTKYFSEEIEKRCRLKDSYTAKRKDAKGFEWEACLAAWWARDFYDLRSKIVHGDAIDYKALQFKDWITHLIVADLVMLEWVQRLLYEHHCIDEDLRRRLEQRGKASCTGNEALAVEFIPITLGMDFESVHADLGWGPTLEERIKLQEERIRNELSQASH